MASLGDQIRLYRAQQELNRPSGEEWRQRMDLQRMESESSRQNQAMAMALEYKKHEWQRHMDMVGVEAEYAAAMGQETKAPTDPRLTQTHKAATTKGQYTYGKAQAKTAADQRKMMWDMMQAQLKSDQWGQEQAAREARLAETERSNRQRSKDYRHKTSAVSGALSNLKSNQAMNHLGAQINRLTSQINQLEEAGIGMDTDKAKELKKTRDIYMDIFQRSLERGAQGTGLGISGALGALDEGGMAGGGMTDDEMFDSIFNESMGGGTG